MYSTSAESNTNSGLSRYVLQCGLFCILGLLSLSGWTPFITVQRYTYLAVSGPGEDRRGPVRRVSHELRLPTSWCGRMVMVKSVPARSVGSTTPDARIKGEIDSQS